MPSIQKSVVLAVALCGVLIASHQAVAGAASDTSGAVPIRTYAADNGGRVSICGEQLTTPLVLSSVMEFTAARLFPGGL